VIGVVLAIGTTVRRPADGRSWREREKGTLEPTTSCVRSAAGYHAAASSAQYLCLGMTMAMPAVRHHAASSSCVPIDGSVIAMAHLDVRLRLRAPEPRPLVATKAENQMQALQMSMAFILPSVFFSGFIFPRETMPAIFYGIGAIMPTTYFIALMRAIILRGATFMEYWQSLAIMSAMAVALFCFCALRFRKKIG
jgi:ABC-2 type transport system permease protein